jgi:hypothetical protein
MPYLLVICVPADMFFSRFYSHKNTLSTNVTNYQIAAALLFSSIFVRQKFPI